MSKVGFQGFDSNVLIKDWLSPAFPASAFMESPFLWRSSLRSFTTSAQTASRFVSLDTPFVYARIALTLHIIKMIVPGVCLFEAYWSNRKAACVQADTTALTSWNSKAVISLSSGQTSLTQQLETCLKAPVAVPANASFGFHGNC